MEKRKRWQFYLILGVLLLTIYNILPTIFYYSHPLKNPIGKSEAAQVSRDIITRVNNLEQDTLSWLKSQSKNLGLKPIKIYLDDEDPRIAHIDFKTPEDARFFSKTLNRAGALIPFAPSQLSTDPRALDENSTSVAVQRKIGIHLDPKNPEIFFKFIPKYDQDGNLTQAYRDLVEERAVEIALGFGGVSPEAANLASLQSNESNSDSLLRIARTIVEFETAFGDNSPITQRYFASFTQSNQPESSENELIHFLTAQLEKTSQKFASLITKIKEEQKELHQKGDFLDATQQQKLEILESQKAVIDSASTIVRRNASIFEKGLPPLTADEIRRSLKTSPVIEIGNRNPFVASIEIDHNKETIELTLHPDVQAIRSKEIKSEADALQVEKLNQLLFSSVATVARQTDETIKPSFGGFAVKLNQLTNSSSFLVLDLGELALQQMKGIDKFLQEDWTPRTHELSQGQYPIYFHSDFKKLPLQYQKLGLVIYAPVLDENPDEGFRKGSIYVIARGLNLMRENYRDQKNHETFEEDFRNLQAIMRQNGFIGYSGLAADLPSTYRDDYIFELDDYASYLLAATRENFSIKGKKRYAVLEFTDVEQRLLTTNRIETEIHEDLVKWRDEYLAAQISLQPGVRYSVPKPTKNVLLNNLKLSAIKYFRGDDRKILKWGLDLSGGKTVRIGLKDENNQEITNETDLRQVMNELYQRVNRLGVSEVGIRTEGSTIVLDFPGSQGLAASDLIQASAMYFHVVNEKFSSHNSMLAEAVNTFLEEVWNEAVITSRTDPESVNEIAWRHLGGDAERPNEFRPLTSYAKLLYDNGLRLAGPKAPPRSSAFNDTLSAVTIFRGSDFADWYGQTNPLLIVFRNYALEGSNLTDVQTGYDPSEGNVLNFSVRSSYANRSGERVNPRDDFYAWTSQFSEEKIAGTPKEEYSQGRGWRMAVILNGTVVSAPTLNAALRDSGRISGHFSQREINQLAADLKAGSLSFTPYILSEENVSPDLGKEQRLQGILAALLGLILVIGVMCVYYKWSGVIASVAVLFNLLIIWGVLQNLGAALTLPSIAGIILAIGMSVDANVLVFERIREEFSATGRLPSSVQTGYRKAFSAILDSNLTTIIAALILLNFDSGPIKGFALTLIIGIVSSMFTSLFVTRYFFAGWVQNPKHKELKMARLFGRTNFNFLRYAKLAFTLSACFILIGGFLLMKEKKTIFGMDFTGGYALTVDLSEKPNTNYRLEATNALVASGAAPSDFQIQELSRPNQLRIQLGTSMEQRGKPFYGIDQLAKPENILYPYQEYPRIAWIVQALENANLQINPSSLPQLNLHWTEMSSQLSDTMRNQALIGLGLALLSILIYITFRFEFKYAISATIALIHDLLITLGALAILHLFFEGIRIDLQVIAAFLTIIGYSLNDTIIIFDRIREDTRFAKKQTFAETVNHALNTTLSRTIMTSGTTLSALLALVIFGGKAIFNFSLIMSLGIIFGTLSSLFIASPLLLYFHGKEKTEENAAKRNLIP